MKMRKLFSFILAVAMSLTITAPALAEDEEILLELEETPEWVDVQIEGEVQEPDTVLNSEPEPEPELKSDPKSEPALAAAKEADGDIISVVVPAEGKVILNPYNIPIDTEAGQTREQIIHQAQALTNNSDFPVSVNAAVIGAIAPESTAQFTAAVPSLDSEAKEIFLYAEFQNQADNWSESYTGASNQVLVSAEGAAGEKVLTIAAKSEGYFRLFGAMSANVDPLWSSDDGVTVTLSYTFTKEESTTEAAEAPGTDAAGEERQEPGDPSEQPQPPAGETDPSAPEEDASDSEPSAPPEDTPSFPADGADAEDTVEAETGSEEPIIEPEYEVPFIPYYPGNPAEIPDIAEEEPADPALETGGPEGEERLEIENF